MTVVNLTGSGSANVLKGGSGADTFVGFVGADTIDGGGATDTLTLSGTSSDLNSATDAQLVSVESITTTAAATINLSNQTEGFTITGSSSADSITGGGGNDTMTGGAGADTMTGGAGAHTFVIASGDLPVTLAGSGDAGTISGYDVVTDFNTTADTLDLPGAAATATNGNVDGAGNSALTIGGDTIKSHSTSNGIAVFFGTDSFTNSLAVTSLSGLAAVVQYLRGSDIGNAGATLAFTSSGSLGLIRYIYQQATTNTGDTGGYPLVDLSGVYLSETSIP